MNKFCRLLTTGTIEEKIYQRQISKASLSESVVDLNHFGSLKLSTAELKVLFIRKILIIMEIITWHNFLFFFF